MGKHDAIPPPERHTSTPPEVKAINARTAALALLLGALTDWIGILAIGALMWRGILPAEPWGWVLAGLAGGTVVQKARGKVAGTTSGAVAVIATKVGVGKGVLFGLLPFVLFAGCAEVLPTLQALAPIAAQAIRDEAARRGERANEQTAMCVPLPEEYQPDDGAIYVVCVAEVEE